MMRGISSKNNEMPIPTRSAPKPPGLGNQNRGNFDWTSNDPFGPLTIPQVQKKKPPPRPPPPRFNNKQNLNDGKTKKPARPTELLGSLFGIKSTTKNQQGQQINVGYTSNDNNRSTNLQSNNVNTGLLIDLSPPASPTSTTRSSSDGVSVDSFGSDGNSNPSLFTNSSNSGNTSQNESAFDDDFDFFKNKKPQQQPNDPWKLKDTNNGWTQVPFDPFDELKNKQKTTFNNIKINDNGIKKIGDTKFFINSNNDASAKIQTMPTIIRARPAKPPAPKIITTNLAPKVTNFPLNNDDNTWPTTTKIPATITTKYNYTDSIFNQGDYSPPMPSVPPPPPPTQYLDKSSSNTFNQRQPHGIALYDFSASQPGDLSLKQGDKVILKKCINNEWLEGQVGNNCGIFPANFVDIVVPLPSVANNFVNALYSFKGETWEDLSFEEGAKINVLSRISDEWLYGEYQGMKGQFPTNYVDNVPQNLPNFSST